MISTGTTADELAATITTRLAEIFGAQPMLAVAPISQEAAELARFALLAGAPAAMAIAHRHGIGALDDGIELICLGDGERRPDHTGVDDGTMMSGLRAAFAALGRPPGIGPGSDRRLGPRPPGPFLRHHSGHCGFHRRPPVVRGPARPSGPRLEDKLVLERLWRSAGLTPPPSRIVELSDRAGLLQAHTDLASTEGTVWAGDNKPGWHGGGDAVRWVAGAEAVDPVADELAQAHDRVRVMPFVDGIPCSIHGMVLGAGTAVFRPAEMIILRDRAARRFVYAKAATVWDPRLDDRDEMRAVARAVGEQLRREVGYRGVFTVDGVMGGDGFVPTEINPRYGGALGSFIRSVEPALNLAVINTAVVEGALDIDPEAFEALIVADHDGLRRGVLLSPTPEPPADDERHLEVVVDGDRLATREVASAADAVDDAFMVLSWGPSVAGGLVLGAINPSVVPSGVSIAPLAARILAAADQEWGLGLPELEPARDVRAEG